MSNLNVNPPAKVTLELTGQETSFLLTALAELPAKLSMNLILKIVEQAEACNKKQVDEAEKCPSG